MISKIYIYTSEPFPYGLAATNRIMAHASGFIANDNICEIIIFRKTENPANIINPNPKGIFRNIKFHYLSNSTIKSPSFFIRRIDEMVIYFRLLVFCIKHLNRKTLALYYSADTFPAIIIWLASRIKKSLFYKDETEHPSVYLNSKDMLSAILFKTIHYSLFDGLILISHPLIDYFTGKKHYKKPVIYVPIVVDAERFRRSKNPTKKWITYCGVLNDRKDGINILIKAFALINKQFKDYQLILIGNATFDHDLAYYQKQAKDFGLTDYMRFMGYINNELVCDLLMKSSLLVLPRPESLQAQYGFPTKFGEYLATGNPVLTTSVGEISDLMTDGVNCYISRPGSVEHFAAKMTEILGNYEKAKQVGKEGRKVVLKYFNNITQARIILENINSRVK